MFSFPLPFLDCSRRANHSPTTAGRMATELPSNGTTTTNGDAESSFTVKTGLARMLKGGVIMDVVNAEQVGIFPSSPCHAAIAH